MSPSNQPDAFDTRNYQRPNQNWLCGRTAEGRPCPIGPGGRGQCQVNQICVPLKSDNGWVCGRAKAWGGRCNEGPIPDPAAPDQQARCPHAMPPCQPRRSLRSQRRLVSGLAFAAALGFCLLVLGGSTSSSSGPAQISTAQVISPGELTSHHSTIQQGCPACHSVHQEAPGMLLMTAFGSGSDLQDSRNCLNCHARTLGPDALHPHSIAPAVLAAAAAETTAQNAAEQPAESRHTLRQQLARLIPEHRATPSGELACATCHQEHHGREFDLTMITNQQCQICHTSSFHSLQDGHPELAKPEPRRDSRLRFDHLTHYQMHFAGDDPQVQAWLQNPAEGGRDDSCGRCHVPDATGRAMLLTDFQSSCASCHDSQITANPLPVLRLPGLPFLTLSGNDWPASTTTDEGTEPAEDLTPPPPAPPWMELLLRADADYVQAIELLQQLPPAGPNLSDTDLDTAARRSAALRQVLATRRQLLDDLLASRDAAARRRLTQSLQADSQQTALITAAVESLAGSGFFDKLREVQQQMRNNTADADADRPDLQQQNPDSQAASPAWEIGRGPGAATGLSLIYHSRGHADRVLQTWLDLAAAVADPAVITTGSPLTAAHDRLLATLVRPQTTGRCIKCHTVSTDGQKFAVHWQVTIFDTDGFTSFSHAPHTTLLHREGQVRSVQPLGDRRCEACHHIQRDVLDLTPPQILPAATAEAVSLPAWLTSSIEPLSITNCASCHTPDAAGNDCLKCHNYHVRNPAGH